ncbi:MAG: transglutaminase-like domain-containing protein [Myxococcota bacterium]
MRGEHSLPSDAWDAFLSFSRDADSDLALDIGALLIAAQAQPEVDVQHWLARLDAMGERIVHALPQEPNSEDRLWTLCRFLTDELGIKGNTRSYYEPQNSYLNRVIDRGLGIPISISVVALELGRRVGVPLRGIGFPGHFLLEHCATPKGYLDPFDLSSVMDEEQCAQLLTRLGGDREDLRVEHFEPVDSRHVLLRMLSNLKLVHSRRKEYLEAIRMIDGILALDPARSAEYRDRGRLYARIEYDGQAEHDLARYLAETPTASDAEAIGALLERVRERLSRYH